MLIKGKGGRMCLGSSGSQMLAFRTPGCAPPVPPTQPGLAAGVLPAPLSACLEPCLLAGGDAEGALPLPYLPPLPGLCSALGGATDLRVRVRAHPTLPLTPLERQTCTLSRDKGWVPSTWIAPWPVDVHSRRVGSLRGDAEGLVTGKST